MPFSTLDSNWSNLAQYYNNSASFKFSPKPEYPKVKYTLFDDGLIRGGVTNVGISSIRDTTRIGKFLLSPKGLLFAAKQFGLQRTNPQLEKAFTDKINLNPTRTYTPLNTILQIPINAIGGHIKRHGIRPIGGVGFLEGSSLNVDGYDYEFIANYNNDFQSKIEIQPDKNSNRLARLFSTTINTPQGSIKLFDYNGGANSVYGLGVTSINTTNRRTTLSFTDTLDANKFNNFQPFSNRKIADAKKWDINSQLKNQLFESPLYKNRVNTSDGRGNLSGSYDIESRIGVSSGTKLAEVKITPAVYDYVDSFAGDEAVPYIVTPEKRENIYKHSVDSINVITVTDSATFYDSKYNLQANTNPDLPKWVLEKGDQNVDGKFGRDIIKFRFEFLNNDNPVGTTINTDVLAFRAYINEFSDGMNAKWDSYRYMGRGEDFYVYNGFTRDISLGFTIYAHSPEEMAPIYKKLNYLLSTFAPDYSAANKMRGNIGYLTVGDYIYRQPGVFTDIKLSGLLETHWEIALDSPEGGSGKDQYEVPKHINVNMSFKPIHTFLPRKAKYKDGKTDRNTPFITIDKKAYPGQASKKGDIESANKYLD